MITAEAEIYFGYDLSVVTDYNFGTKSSPDNEDNFGGYFGAGFGNMHTNYNTGGGANNVNSYGPLVRGGLRFTFANDNNRTLSVGAYYKKGMEKDKFNTVGFNVLYDL